jgi:hypothetical protein
MLVINFRVIRIVVVTQSERLTIPKYTMIEFAITAMTGMFFTVLGLAFGIIVSKLLEILMPLRTSKDDALTNFK